MKSMGIKELQTNPADLTRALEADEYTMITKHSKPIGLAIAFDDKIVTQGLKTALLSDAYVKGYLSLGQVADALGQSKAQTLKMLSALGIEAINYDFEDDLALADRLS